MADDDLNPLELRLTGNVESISTLMGMIRSIDNIDRVVDLGARQRGHARDDSSSAGLAEAAAADFHDVEIHAMNPDALEQVRDLVEVAGRDLGVVVEYLDDF